MTAGSVVPISLAVLAALCAAGCNLLGPRSNWRYRPGIPCTMWQRVILRDGTAAWIGATYGSCPDTTGLGALGHSYTITRPGNRPSSRVSE